MSIPTDKTEWPSDYFSNDLRLMAATITRLELWDWFNEEHPPENTGYSFWGHPNIDKISANLMDDEGNLNNPHSGCSFACAMRNMQTIAQIGFPAWKVKYENNSKCPE